MWLSLNSINTKKLKVAKSAFISIIKNSSLLKNTSWIFLEKLIRLSLGFVVLGLIARHLGPHSFGTLAYALALISIFSPLISLGLNRAIVREIVKDPDSETELLLSVFLLKLIMATVCTVFINLVVHIAETDLKYIITILSLTNIFMCFDVIEYHFQAHTKSIYSSIYKTSAFLIISLTNLIMIQIEASATYFALTHTIEFILIALLSVYFFLLKNKKIIPKANIKRAVWLVRNSWPEIGAGIATALCIKFDQLMLEHYVGLDAVGYYNASSRLIESTYFVPSAIVASCFPLLVKLKNLDEARYKESLEAIFLVVMIAAYTMTLLINIFADELITFIFGAEYNKSAEILVIYAWCIPAMALGLCSGAWIFAEERVMLALYRMSVGLISNLILNLILIPIYAEKGAAISTVLSLYIAFFIFDYFNSAMRYLFFTKVRAITILGSAKSLKSFLIQSQSGR